MDKLQLARKLGHIQILPKKLRRQFIKKLVGNHSDITNFDFTIQYLNNQFHGNSNNLIDWNIYFLGGYELHILNLIKHIALTSQHSIAIDIGANIGNHTLTMANYFDTVHAFEPYPIAFKRLKKNIQLNQLNNVILHEIGLYNKTCELPYYENSENNLGGGSFCSTHDKVNSSPSFYLSLTTGDELFPTFHLPQIDLIKMDIEGLEVEALVGISQTIKSFRPFFIFEYGDTTKQKVTPYNNLFNLFPENYQFFKISKKSKFKSFIPRLKKISSENFNGKNIIASPNEKVNFLFDFLFV